MTINVERLNGLSAKESKDFITSRTQQLLELLQFDPKNAKIYQDELVVVNIKLVPHVLKKYKPFGEDEYQLGCLGLIIAVKSFEPEKGVPFSSYACFCIERELHKAYRKRMHQFEGQLGNSLESLDELVLLGNGDTILKHETIRDYEAEYAFEDLLEQHSLHSFFDKVVIPAVDSVGDNTKGQTTIVNMERWKDLEMRYLLEMAQIKSQKARLSLSTIAKDLGVSIQNIRMRHQRVIALIKRFCTEQGYVVDSTGKSSNIPISKEVD